MKCWRDGADTANALIDRQYQLSLLLAQWHPYDQRNNCHALSSRGFGNRHSFQVKSLFIPPFFSWLDVSSWYACVFVCCIPSHRIAGVYLVASVPPEIQSAAYYAVQVSLQARVGVRQLFHPGEPTDDSAHKSPLRAVPRRRG